MPAKKQITRDMILEAAIKLLRRNGFESVGIKELAKELKCSTQPVYLSFKGMDELRSELVIVAVQEFERIMAGYSRDGIVRLYDMEYVLFAKEEPALFNYLFMRANAFEETKRCILPIIEKSVKELMDTYKISHDCADRLHDHLWMHTHGIAAMIATDFCEWDMKKVECMLKECKQSFVSTFV